jgi:hypothetical protein
MLHLSTSPSLRPARDILPVGTRAFTFEEVANILCVAKTEVQHLFESGQLPGLRLNKKHGLILESGLLQYLERESEVQTRMRKPQLSNQSDASCIENRAVRRKHNVPPDLARYSHV